MTSAGEAGADDGLVQIGAVRTFDPLPQAHETARKLGEEVMEAFSAYEDWERAGDGDAREAAKGQLMLELSDVVQAVANMAAACGVEDMRPLMAACEARNRARGRL